LRIALFTEMEKVDGQGRFTLLLARWLKSHGHEPVVLSPESPLLRQIDGLNIPHVPINSVLQGRALHYPEFITDVGRILDCVESFRPDVMFATAVMPYLLAKPLLREKVPVFLPVCSDIYFVPFSPFNQQLVNDTVERGQLLGFAYDPVEVHAHTFGFDARKARYLPLPIDNTCGRPSRPREAVREELGVAPEELMVLIITRLDRDKAPTVPPLAAAVDRLRADGIPIRLVVVGDGTHAASVRATSSPETIFTGSRYDLADLYAATDLYFGEGTTIFEAAMARKPVVVTGAGFHPDTPGKAFGIYGIHVIDHAFLKPTAFNPLTDFIDVLRLLVVDAALRESLAQAAYETVMTRNFVDVVMPWMLDIFVDSRHPSMLFGEDAALLVHVPGGLADGIDVIGKVAAKIGNEIKLAVEFSEPVPWSRTLALPVAHARALALAVRRRITSETIVATFDGRFLNRREGLPERFLDALDAALAEMPPTSTAPALRLRAPRSRVFGIVAASHESVPKLLQSLPPELDPDTDAVVVWVMQSLSAPDLRNLAAFLQRTLGRVEGVLVAQPIAWTFVGRLVSAFTSYRDDGTESTAPVRRLAEELGIAVGESLEGAL